jgi:polar amino acid transport system substrate-binding protein
MKKTFKTVLCFLLASLFIISAVGCSSGGSSTEVKTGTTSSYAYLLDTSNLNKPTLDLSNPTGQLKTILDSGVLRIATSPDYPPAEFVTADGTVYGSEMMLAKYVADCLGVDLKIETMDFSGTFVAVDTGKVDLGISGYGWKADRAESYELTTGYIGNDEDEGNNYHTLICAAGNETKYNSLESLVGAHIIAQASSLQQMYVEDQIIALDPNAGTELEMVATLDQAILALASGKCDAVALDGTTAAQYVKESDGAFAETGIKFDTAMYGDREGNVMCAKKGETAFVEVLNQIIDCAMENGYYKQFYDQAREQAVGVEGAEE